MQFVCRIACVVLIVLAVGPVLAQASKADEQGTLNLTLDEALRIALKNNLDLITARQDPDIAAQQVEIERSIFDGTVGANLDFTKTSADLAITNNRITPSPVENTEQNSENFQGGVNWSQLLNFGATYEVSLSPSQTKTDAQNIGDSGFPQAVNRDVQDGNISLVYRMPLLRGFGREVNTERLILARSNQEMSREDLRAEAELVMQTVEGAYWNVVAASAALRTAELALNRAEDLLELNRKKVEVGTLAPIEITQAEAGVASQQEGVIVSEMTLRDAEDELRRLLAIPAADPAWSLVIDAVDRPRFEEQSIDVEQAIAAAMVNRPEVINAKQVVANRELSERVARKNVRHSLDLVARATPFTSDDDRINVFPSLPPEQSTDTTTETDGLQWNVGVTWSVPLQNRDAKARRSIAAINRKKAEYDLQNVEQTVRVDVRSAVRGVESGIKRVEAAQKNVELQNEKLEAEQKKFENGMSTSFEVLTFQNDLADAELALIRAGLDYAKALTAVERAKGTLLEARGLSLDGE